MRVVAGVAKGRTLVAPRGRGTRPTTDQVREAIFNALGSLGAVDGARVLDLFAGSGALGIEALSRGAAEAVFVDDDPKALEAVRTNLAATGLTGTVVRGNAATYRGGGFDLALLDPPYATADEEWRALVESVDAPLVVLESDRAIDLGEAWEVLRSKRYGSTVVQIVRRKGAK